MPLPRCLTPLLLLLCLSSAHAEPQIEVRALFLDFDRSFYEGEAKIVSGAAGGRGRVLSAPRVTTRSNQQARIEVIREVKVPFTVDGKNVVTCGVTLDVLPELVDEKVKLSGCALVRALSKPGVKKNFEETAFTSRETYFQALMGPGKPIILSLAANPRDQARCILSVKIIKDTKQ